MPRTKVPWETYRRWYGSRDDAMWRLRHSPKRSWSLERIGAKYGLSRQRVHQILDQYDAEGVRSVRAIKGAEVA